MTETKDDDKPKPKADPPKPKKPQDAASKKSADDDYEKAVVNEPKETRSSGD